MIYIIGELYVRNTHINTLFIPNINIKCVTGSFICSRCDKLTNLEGSPELVGGNFSCRFCSSLITLEGGPKNVSGDYSCNSCDRLKSLKGSPEKVGKEFDCGSYIYSRITQRGGWRLQL